MVTKLWKKLKPVDLNSPEPERLVSFYESLFGMTFEALSEGKNSHYQGVHFNQMIRIRQKPEVNEPEVVVPQFVKFKLKVVFDTAFQKSLDQLRMDQPGQQPATSEQRSKRQWNHSVRDPDGNLIFMIPWPKGRLARFKQALIYALPFWMDFAVFKLVLQTKIVDRLSYSFDTIRVLNSDLRGFTHLMSSREGLYAINKRQYQKILEGQFFGLTFKDQQIYCFQAHDIMSTKSFKGRVIVLEVEHQKIQKAEVAIKGLDNGCHQMDFINDRLYIADTYNQRVTVFEENLKSYHHFYPLPKAKRFQYHQGYVHMNSISCYDGQIYLLLHNGWKKQSEIIRTDFRLNIQERSSLPGFGCHDIVFLEDDSYLVCNSAFGSVINGKNLVIEVGNMMTRGLSVDEETIAVGDSFYAIRLLRRYAPGNVYFYDRDYQFQAKLPVPAAPTDIRKIDGRDYAVSNYWLTKRTTLAPVSR